MSDHKQKNTKGAKFLNPGQRFFTVFLLAFAGFFLWQSIDILHQYPKVSGPAFFPLCISGLMIFLVILDFVKSLKIPAIDAGVPLDRKLIDTFKYVFPKESFIFLLICIAYFVLLVLGVPFMIASVLFLMGSMCYMIPHNIVKNAIYTVVLLVAIYLIFVLVFKVSLP